jgi:transposase
MLRMEAVHGIRHLVLAEGWGIRRAAREFGVSRNTVRRYLAGAEPGVRKPAERARPVFESVRCRIDEILADSARWTQGKQRLTATQLHRMLVGEGHVVGATLVKQYVAEWKRQRREVYVPLDYPPGDLAEVDFFEVYADVGGERRKAFLFVMRLMCSGRDFAWLYPRQDQVCFLDGHVRAFAHFACVPRRLAYDNLKPAVARILTGSERELTARMRALATHYAFEPCFARPGTGHDKGGVESRGRAIRWQHLVPIPTGPDLATISKTLIAGLDRQAETQRDRRGRTIAERFADERAEMLELPQHAFRAAAVVTVAVTPRSLVRIEGAYYSVPCRWAGLALTAYVAPETVTIVGPDESVEHPRLRFGERSIRYRHYLPELARKPQAVRQVAHRLVPELGEPFAALWRRLVDEHSPREAARRFAPVLGAIVRRGESRVAAEIERALHDGTSLAHALAEIVPPPKTVALDRLPPSVAGIEVLAASARDYDALLGVAS